MTDKPADHKPDLTRFNALMSILQKQVEDMNLIGAIATLHDLQILIAKHVPRGLRKSLMTALSFGRH